MSFPREQSSASVGSSGKHRVEVISQGAPRLCRGLLIERTCAAAGCLGQLGEPAHHVGQLFISISDSIACSPATRDGVLFLAKCSADE